MNEEQARVAPRRNRPPAGRALVMALAFVEFGAVLSETPAQESVEPAWWRQALVGMEVGPTGTERGAETGRVYAEEFNGRDIVRRCVEAGCDYLVIWARDGEFAYYDSAVLPKPPGLGERDVLRETLDEAKKHDLPIIAYCVVQYGSHALRAHPDYASTSEHRIVEARRLLRNAVEFLRPDPLVRIEAPRHVETIVSKDPATRTLRVHLLGYVSPPATTPPKNRPYVIPSLIEDRPMYRATIHVKPTIREVETFNESTSLEREGQRLDLVVEDVHEVVVIRYEKS